MSQAESNPNLDADLGRIESTILPSLTMMLDALLDAAAIARPGHDAAAYAAEIQSLAAELDNVTRHIELLSTATPQRANAA